MTFDLIEKPPAFEEDEEATVSPLPSRWNKDDKHSALEVLGDGYEVKYTGHRSERDHDAAAIRADHYMPPQCGVYYFEVLILHRKREDTTIAIGFSNSSAALSRAPGWEPGSWGYHGDDGNSFASQNIGKPYGPKFGPGDTIGCLVNFRTGTALFTKNGDELGIAFRDINKDAQGKLFPTIGLKKPGDHILANFGQLPFQFDIDGYMRAEKKSIMDRIDKADTSKLAPPWKEKELIQRLVLQFLQHDGYVETARAFAEEVHAEKAALSNEPGMPLEGINVKDDEDARKRQQIRRAVLEGKIDQALKWVNLYYPQVLADHREVYFRLRCRKFIEMIRKDAEETMRQESGADAEKKDTSAAAPSRTTQQHDVEDEEMEEADGSQQPQQQQQQQQQQQPEWDEQMETEGNDGEAAPPIGKLLQEALLYGQDLRAEFDGWDNPEMSRHLDEIFALIAYKNPLKVKEVAHLLDRSGRVAVAEELNSAILHSLGKSSRAALETLYAQTEVFLDILRRDGGDGAFVTVKDVMDSIPTSQLRS
ncbi:hypothetical protein VTK73DRAFT_5664 [Phialemonium thermophilum]|uniref:Protein ssh4 n=1 Tax=Phialemonium thermophilum TaxID=223376 RepID=A0ABR3WMI6_9PEZI